MQTIVFAGAAGHLEQAAEEVNDETDERAKQRDVQQKIEDSVHGAFSFHANFLRCIKRIARFPQLVSRIFNEHKILR